MTQVLKLAFQFKTKITNICPRSSAQYTVRPRSGDPFHIVSYYVKWVTTSWTYSSNSEQVAHVRMKAGLFENRIQLQLLSVYMPRTFKIVDLQTMLIYHQSNDT